MSRRSSPKSSSVTASSGGMDEPHSDLFQDRSSGILAHLTSLPGPHGCGDLGPPAHEFVAYLAQAGQRWWQTLPVGPPGRGDSPYDGQSSFAGSALLLSLQDLVNDGLLSADELTPPPALAQGKVKYNPTRRFREEKLRLAHSRFIRQKRHLRADYERFRERTADWLPDYCLFRVLRDHIGKPWTEWDPELRRRDPHALGKARSEHISHIQYHEFIQYSFDRQWSALRTTCRGLGVRLLGDVPIYVAHDTAEVWANPQLFHLDSGGECTVVSGVPPDAFSKTGQLWGNPLYRWESLQETDFAWWVARLRASLSRFDAVRLDHFIGFHRYWEVPARARTARRGRFVPVPGRQLFAALKRELGGLPFVAEDLGRVTPEVRQLLNDLGLPGMRVLQFAFDGGDGREYLPHRYDRRTVVYTGTHDNDTTLGWYRELERTRDLRTKPALKQRRDRLLQYLGTDGTEIHWDLIRLALGSVANTAIIPLQDVLGLGSSARMNVPGTPTGNWSWRLQPGQLSPEIAERLAKLTATYERPRRDEPRGRGRPATPSQ